MKGGTISLNGSKQIRMSKVLQFREKLINRLHILEELAKDNQSDYLKAYIRQIKSVLLELDEHFELHENE